jgi:hypothetical protein
MEFLKNFGLLVLIIFAVLAVATFVLTQFMKAALETAPSITETEEFKIGYAQAKEDCEKDGDKQARESVRLYREALEFNPRIYGYACFLADVAHEPRPEPWGKSNA